MIETVSLDGAHGPLEIVQTKVVTPVLNPVTAEEGLEGVLTLPLPAITVQAPVPEIAESPASTALVVQTCWSVPALATVGGANLLIVTVSADDPHDVVVIVQTKVFVPTLSPVTPEAGSVGADTVPPPARTLHVPDPEVGALAARLADAEQTS